MTFHIDVYMYKQQLSFTHNVQQIFVLKVYLHVHVKPTLLMA